MSASYNEQFKTWLPTTYAERMQFSVPALLHGQADPSRTKRQLQLFSQFAEDQDMVVKSGADLSLLFSTFQHIRFGEKTGAIETKKSDITKLRYALESLIDTESLPFAILPPVLSVNPDVFRDMQSASNKVLGNLDPKQGDTDGSYTLLLQEGTLDFIKRLVEEMRFHRNLLLQVSRQYLKDAHERFEFGQKAIQEVDETIFEDDELLHHSKNVKRQRYSLFSKHLPDNQGLKHLIAYLYHHHGGLVSDDFIGSNNHLSAHCNHYELREYLGISSLSAVAAQIIIIIESGINVDSLRNLKLSTQGGTVSFFEPTPNGFRITYQKKRAKRNKNRIVNYLEENEINTQFSFEYLHEATAKLRTPDCEDKDYLFIFDSVSTYGTAQKMSSTPFKYGISRILTQAQVYLKENKWWGSTIGAKTKLLDSDKIDRVLACKPNAKKVRATEGVLHWFDGGGDARAAARYLGNCESVAIRNYIPKELQIAVYTQQIRRFQNVMISAATDGMSYQIEALDLKDPEELAKYLAMLEEENENWRNLGKTATDSKEEPPAANDDSNEVPESPEMLPNEDMEEKQVTIILNKHNIALLRAAAEIHLKCVSENITPPPIISKFSTVYISTESYIRANGIKWQSKALGDGNDLFDAMTDAERDFDFTSFAQDNL